MKGWRRGLVTLSFLAPALVVLGAFVGYPIVFTLVRSLYDRAGTDFVGLANYEEMLRSGGTRTAIRNSAVWVVVAPSVVTAVGLIFAVLTERVRWGTAFKVVVFMPMAISFLSAGVIFRLAYETDPNRGLMNAMVGGVADVLAPPGAYPGARSSDDAVLRSEGRAFVAVRPVAPGDVALLGLVAIPPRLVPPDAVEATAPPATPGAVTGLVWLDFSPAGESRRSVIDGGERGLPGVVVEAWLSGKRVASATTDASGRFHFTGLSASQHQLRLSDRAFRPAFGGVDWLGPGLVTPAVMGAYVWIWAGFAMVVIAAGLAAIPRDVLEAARVDGATEWQVFRRVTVPLLGPVLLVVLVTMIINVLKVFDLVLVIPPGSTQADANVVALEMWRQSFGGARDHGLGSALAVLLFVLVLPAMVFQIRRLRSER